MLSLAGLAACSHNVNIDLITLWSRAWSQRARAATDQEDALFCLSMSARYQAIAEHLIRHGLADHSHPPRSPERLAPAFEFGEAIDVRRHA